MGFPPAFVSQACKCLRILCEFKPSTKQTDSKEDSRKARWTRLCSSMLGGDKYVGTMTALLNLDWRHSVNEKEIPEEDLLNGLSQYVWPLLVELRPRLVCPLTKRVWKIIAHEIEALRVPFPSCPFPLRREPIVFKLPECAFPSILVKPDNHPSRALSYKEITVVGKACQWFLKHRNARKRA